jgi:hypothetical protein
MNRSEQLLAALSVRKAFGPTLKRGAAELLLQNNSSNKKELDVKVKSRRRSLRRRKKMERIDELSDDEDNKTD